MQSDKPDVREHFSYRLVDELSDFQKLATWLHYYGKMQMLKSSVYVVDTMPKNWQKNRWEPDKLILSLAFYFLWKNIRVLSFNEFFGDNNVWVRDWGAEWQKNGFAQRYSIETSGIYDWYWKHENDIKTAFPYLFL